MALVLVVAQARVLTADVSLLHLESRRLGSAAVYVGSVGAVRRIGGLDGLTGDAQGRLEAAIKVAKVLRAPAGVTPPDDVPLRFDSRAPEPEGEGFYTLAAGEAVLVFADGFEAAYPRELMHGVPRALSAQVKELRDFVASMDADTMRLHGLDAATRLAEVKLYDQALTVIARMK